MPLKASHTGDYAPFVYMGRQQEVPLNVTNVLIHASVKVIPRGAFEGRHRLKQVEFQEGIEVIGDSAFCNCTGLEHVRLASTIKTIGTAAFAFCLSLEQIDLNHGLVKIGCAAFCGCISLTFAKVPSTVWIVREGAFLNCTHLQQVVLESGVTTIGNLAFANCDLQECPSLPETIFSIGYQALPSVLDDDEAAAKGLTTHSNGQQLDHVKLNARRELEIHTLQDQLEQVKLENAQLLAQLESISKERDELQGKLLLKTSCKNEQPLCQDGFQSSKVKEETLSMLNQDLPVIPPITNSSKKSCWKDMMHLLQAPVRLSMNKFAELDAYMAAHNQMMQEQQRLNMQDLQQGLPVVEDDTIATTSDIVEAMEDLVKNLVPEQDAESLDPILDNHVSQSHKVHEDEEESLESIEHHVKVTVPSLLPREESITTDNVAIAFEIVNANGNDNDDEDWIADAFDIY